MDQVRPRLRPHLVPVQDKKNPDIIGLWDKLRLSRSPIWLSRQELAWLPLLDGKRSVGSIWEEVWGLRNGSIPNRSEFEQFLARLEQALYLDTPEFRQQVDGPNRTPQCTGCYSADPAQLRRQIRSFFQHPRGPGMPTGMKIDRKLRAAFLPHIDYPRGGCTYAYGFKEIFEKTNSSLFVIIGTSHYSTHRFTLTRKNFQTPLGLVPTDQAYIDKLVANYGDGLFDDEWLAHIPEHSIELEIIFLQYLYENVRPIRIVPLVVGPFWDHIQANRVPAGVSDIGRMIQALQAVERELSEPVCYIISGDLAHIGPKFGDPKSLDRARLSLSRKQDMAILKHAERGDASGVFRLIAQESDARRICGLPPMFTVLEAINASRGKVLHYDQYQHAHGYESVSFASVAFYESQRD